MHFSLFWGLGGSRRGHKRQKSRRQLRLAMLAAGNHVVVKPPDTQQYRETLDDAHLALLPLRSPRPARTPKIPQKIKVGQKEVFQK
eukprot:2107797-Amphidinium_carterae.1